MITLVCLSDNNNICFSGRKPNNSRQFMNEVLTPLVDKFTPVKEIIRQTNFTRKQIDLWSLINHNMTISKLYKTRQHEIIKNKLIEYRSKGITIKDLTKIFGHTAEWINTRGKEFGIKPVNYEKQQQMSEHLPWMLDAGYTYKMIKKQLKISISTIQRWISENLGCSITEYRKANNIKIKRA